MRILCILIVVSAALAACASRSAAESDGGPDAMACTEIGCHDGLVVTMTPTSAWPHGAYRFTIEADGTTTTCTGTLPLPACETRALTCDRDDPVIGESGCALPAAEHAFGDIVFASAPTSISITVTRDEEPVATQSFTPTYQTVQPNGPGCPPTCTHATEQLALPFD